jgi:hypothetical protein
MMIFLSLPVRKHFFARRGLRRCEAVQLRYARTAGLTTEMSNFAESAFNIELTAAYVVGADFLIDGGVTAILGVGA